MSHLAGVSIVIPSWNEERLLPQLCQEITEVMRQCGIPYKIHVVDDHSRVPLITSIPELISIYQLDIIRNVGKSGRTRSILLGIQSATYDNILALNADEIDVLGKLPELFRQYTPNKLMLVRSPRARYSAAMLFSKAIFERLRLRTRNSSFEHEFVKKAGEAGYLTTTLYFRKVHKRRWRWHPSKLLRFAAAIRTQLYLRFIGHEVFAFDTSLAREHGYGFHYLGRKYVVHSLLSHKLSAFHRLSSSQIVAFIFMLLSVLIGLYFNWRGTILLVVALLTVIYFCDLLFNLYLIYRSFAHPAELNISDDEISAASDNWPAYTILCPLYREAHVIPQFVKAMSRLDYPPDKLQILLLLEQDDKETINKASSMELPSNFTILTVPHSLPKTKPKACNYGLNYAKGEYVTIYDAEDIPEPTQLKKAVIAFRRLGSRTICVQAKLNFYNPKQNLLTRIFTAEYSLWFDLVLTGLHSIGAPIPLGGTSNHFPTAYLHKLHGWDAFNVTEDCDLGMRLVKRGYKTAIIDSVTFEEANSGVLNWLLQRTRWIKGYIQTYFVHIRQPKNFARFNWKNFIAFQVIVGGKIMSMFINPLMWLITISYFVFRSTIGIWIEQFYPTPILYMAVFSLVFGNFLYMYYYMIGCAKREYEDLIKYVIFVPFYWLGMSVAAWRAVGEMIIRPHYWSKTIHGLHLDNQKIVEQAGRVVGYNLEEKK